MYEYRLEKLKLRSGIEISPRSLTVVVGANNSGKSRLLKDIERLCTTRERDTLVVESIDIPRPESIEEVLMRYDVREVKSPQGNITLNIFRSDMNGVHQVGDANWREYLRNCITNWDSNRGEFSYYLGHRFVTLLGTEERLRMTKQVSRNQAMNLLEAFYNGGSEVERTACDMVLSAFGTRIKFDYTGTLNFSIRSGDDFSEVPLDPRDARPVMERFPLLDDQGDGMRSFVATVLAVLIESKPVLLIDEPEAFLHPPQALRLGQIIAELAGSNRQVIVATHSADFLRGVLSRRSDITLIRLTRMGGGGTARVLDAEDVARVSQNPVLSSTRVLDGLFYRGVVVVEADSDSAFYQRVSQSLRAGDEIHYTHAHSKQALAKLVVPYVKMGVNTAVITDFDILRRRDEFATLIRAMAPDYAALCLEMQELIRAEVDTTAVSEQLEALRSAVELAMANTPDSYAPADDAVVLSDLKRRIKRALEESDKWARCKRQGRAALSRECQRVFDELNDVCMARGLFIVPVGELESWLVDFGVERSSNKNHWITLALQRLFEEPLPPNSLVGRFVSRVHDYLLSGQ